MNSLLLLPPPTETKMLEQFSPPLNIALIFADAVLAKKSVDIYNEFVEQFAPDAVFNASWWNFNRLQQPQLFEHACNAAAEADIVIVAAPADQELPEAVKGLIDLACGKPVKPHRRLIAVIGLEDAVQPVHSPANLYLQAAAREAGMEYYQRCVAVPTQVPNGSLTHIHHRASALTPLLAEILSHSEPVPHGGINE